MTDCQQTVRAIHARFFSGSPARAAACALLKEQNKADCSAFRDSAACGLHINVINEVLYFPISD